jgi:hypothetical protein
VVIDGGTVFVDGTEVEADYNAYYNAEQLALPGTNDVLGETAADAHHEELCFDRRIITGPEQFCIPHGRATAASPHADPCDPQLGSRPGVGIDDEPIPPPP